MNLQTIAEHTVDMDFVNRLPSVLDLGCLGFDFANHFIRIGCWVDSVDINVVSGGSFGVSVTGKHYNIGITSFDGLGYLIKNNDPQATTVKRYEPNGKTPSTELVECMTIDSFTKLSGINLYDIIKMDIEGSEYEVIMSMDKPYAMQISVEFHTHCGQTEKQVQQCVDKLHSLGYKTIQHEKTARHGLKPNYWDSLFCL